MKSKVVCIRHNATLERKTFRLKLFLIPSSRVFCETKSTRDSSNFCTPRTKFLTKFHSGRTGDCRIPKYVWILLRHVIILLLILTALTSDLYAHRFSLMIDPAGDAQHTGRTIEDSFERGITLQCAEHIKQILEARYPTIRVVLTRFPGETVSHLQNATFANRLAVDLYVNINFYEEQNIKPQLHLYSFSYGDEFLQTIPPLSFCPIDKAYLVNHATTRAWARKIQEHLNAPPYKKLFDTHNILYVPFKPLLGIKAPAIALDAGLKNKNDWLVYVEPFAQALGAIIEQSC